MLRKEQEKSLNLMRERLEKEFEDAKLELLKYKEDNLRKLKEEAHIQEEEEEKEGETLNKEKQKSISDQRQEAKIMGEQLILEEDYDENYNPTEGEIVKYATTVIGIDPDTEPHLMWIAREGISAPLPADWKPCQDTSGGDIYYFNFTSGESTWDHPCDEIYRKMVQEEKDKPKTTGRGSTGARKKEGKKKKKKEKKDGGRKNQDISQGRRSAISMGSLGLLRDSTLESPFGSLKGSAHLSTLGTVQDPVSTIGSTSGELEDAKLELLEDKNDNLRLNKDDIRKEEEKEEETPNEEKQKSIRFVN
eukprot:XP_011669121.1 PREDICTED: centrosomal protein of 164 kDa-like [Strongylocentrotus purpuratus]